MLTERAAISQKVATQQPKLNLKYNEQKIKSLYPSHFFWLNSMRQMIYSQLASQINSEVCHVVRYLVVRFYEDMELRTVWKALRFKVCEYNKCK